MLTLHLLSRLADVGTYPQVLASPVQVVTRMCYRHWTGPSSCDPVLVLLKLFLILWRTILGFTSPLTPGSNAHSTNVYPAPSVVPITAWYHDRMFVDRSLLAFGFEELSSTSTDVGGDIMYILPSPSPSAQRTRARRVRQRPSHRKSLTVVGTVL
jgi:hypothetical protein